MLVDAIDQNILNIRSKLGIFPVGFDIQKLIIDLWTEAFQRNVYRLRLDLENSSQSPQIGAEPPDKNGGIA